MNRLYPCFEWVPSRLYDRALQQQLKCTKFGSRSARRSGFHRPSAATCSSIPLQHRPKLQQHGLAAHLAPHLPAAAAGGATAGQEARRRRRAGADAGDARLQRPHRAPHVVLLRQLLRRQPSLRGLCLDSHDSYQKPRTWRPNSVHPNSVHPRRKICSTPGSLPHQEGMELHVADAHL